MIYLATRHIWSESSETFWNALLAYALSVSANSILVPESEYESLSYLEFFNVLVPYSSLENYAFSDSFNYVVVPPSFLELGKLELTSEFIDATRISDKIIALLPLLLSLPQHNVEEVELTSDSHELFNSHELGLDRADLGFVVDSYTMSDSFTIPPYDFVFTCVGLPSDASTEVFCNVHYLKPTTSDYQSEVVQELLNLPSDYRYFTFDSFRFFNELLQLLQGFGKSVNCVVYDYHLAYPLSELGDVFKRLYTLCGDSLIGLLFGSNYLDLIPTQLYKESPDLINSLVSKLK